MKSGGQNVFRFRNWNRNWKVERQLAGLESQLDWISANADAIERRIYRRLDRIEARFTIMENKMDELIAAVAKMRTASDSAQVLLKGLADKIAAGANDPAAMKALAAELVEESDELSAAVAKQGTETPPAT